MRHSRCPRGRFAAALMAAALAASLARADVLIDGIRYPDPLQRNDGGRVTTVSDWEAVRRAELIHHFREAIYGHPLRAPTAMTFSARTTRFAAITRRIVAIAVQGPFGTKEFKLRLFIPRNIPAPPAVFLLIDHRSDITDDPGQNTPFLPVVDITRRGYAAAAFDVAEVAPDDAATYRSGMINLFHRAGNPLPANAGRTISAWAWAASRAMDYLVKDNAIDRARVAIVGHSRGGKTALLAGAQDTRFAYVIGHDSGAAGAKLARRVNDGQTIRSLNTAFPHWFCENYRSYNNNAAGLPVDQHELIALAAPRAVYVASATDSPTSDPKGQFLGHVGAMPVYELYGLGTTGLRVRDWQPATNTPFHGEAMGYHLRRGSHGLLRADWTFFLDFADQYWRGSVRPAAAGDASRRAGPRTAAGRGARLPAARPARPATRPGARAVSGAAGSLGHQLLASVV